MIIQIRQLGAYYKKISKEIRAAFWYTVSNITQKAVSVLLIPIYVRLMSMDEYGIYTYYQSLIPFLMIICTLNVTGPVIYKGMNDFKENRDEFVTNVLGVMTFLSTALFLLFQIGYIFSYVKTQSIVGLDRILGCCCIAEVWSTYVNGLWRCKKRYNYNYRAVITLNFLISICNLLFGMCAIFFAPDKLYGVIICKLSVQMMAGLYVMFDILRGSKRIFNKYMWKYIFLKCIPLLSNIIALRIVQRSDQRIILELCSESALAIYGLAFSISSLIYVFTDAFDNTLSPMITQALEAKEFTFLRKETLSFLIAICGISSIQCILSPELVMFLGTSSYSRALYCVMPLIMSVVLEFTANLMIYVLVFYDRKKSVTVASVFIAVANIVLNLVFVRKYGFIAAAYTTLASYFGYFSLIVYSYKRTIKTIKVFDLKRIVALLMVNFILCATGPLLNNYLLARIGIILILIGVGMIILKRANTG